MGTERTRLAAVAAGLLLCVGCTTYGANTIVSYLYYFYGPEDALEALDSSVIAPENLALADLERAMALLELGRYQDSLEALARAETRLETEAAEPVVGGPERKHPPWRPEIHERVLVPTMAMANSLALYDVGGAAAAADRAMGEIAEIGCGSCDFDFTRVLAALAYGGAGRFADGIAALDGKVATGRREELVDALRRRLDLGVAAVQPAGLAPPPVESKRFVIAILLLGRGPYKESAKLDVSPGVTIQWCRYLPRGPQAVSWAAIELENPPISVELTDVEALAVEALDFRAQRVIAGEESPTAPDHPDLRHWASLPASMQLLVVDLPPGDDYVDLVYYSPEGFEVDRETIDVPSEWWGGPIYVLRRMP
jgi:hypothetical protein